MNTTEANVNVDATIQTATKDVARLKSEDKNKLLSHIDKWKKRVRYYKKDKDRIAYAIHDFTIGAQNYRFYERRSQSPLERDGILVNPAYKVDDNLNDTGAVLLQRGELTFWFYHNDTQGWFSVRELTINEMICTEIIYNYGMVSENKI